MASSHETGSIAIIQKAGGVLQPLPHGELFEKAQAATAAVGAIPLINCISDNLTFSQKSFTLNLHHETY